MTARQCLREALAIITKHHTATQLADDGRGGRVNPRSPQAARWSSTGALITISPRYPERTAPNATPLASDTANNAYDLLCEAATQQGFANPTQVDGRGADAAARMFWRALQLADDPPARKRKPKGH